MPNKLPQGWVECQLKDIATVKGGKRLPAGAKYSESITNYPYIRVTNFENMTVNTNDLKYLTPEIQNKIKNYTISKEDIYISIAGSIGKVGIIPDELDGANLTENAAKIIHCINKKFLTFILISIEIQNQISTYTKSTTQPKLALYRIEELKILLPPLNEQRRIVEKIESEFAKIDEGLEHLENAKEQIKQYRQSVLKSAFEGKLYKTSEWEIGELKKFCLKVNKRKISNNEQEEFFYIDISSIDNKNNILLSATKYNGKNAPSRARQIVKSEDILFSTVRTYLKNIAIVPPEYDNEIASTGFCVIRTNSNLLYSKFMFYKSLSDKFLEPLNKLQRGSSYPAVRDNDVLSQIICIPHSIEEQKKIVEEIEKRFAVVDDVEKVVEENIEKAKQLKQSILKKAFEGRLVPQDPTDEPASTLLEKIKQERSKKK